jgi:para-nitrobenzyl esterase
MQSGYASTRWPTRAAAESIGNDFSMALRCTEPRQVLSCMRSKTRDDVLLALPSGQQQFAETMRVSWGPVVDGLDIPDQPRTLYENGEFNHVPVIAGATRDEGWAYVDRSFPAGLSREVYEATVEAEFGTADAAAILAMYPADGFASPKHALAQITGDVETVCEARRIARLVERTRTPVYLYSFERKSDAAVADNVIHGRDTNFVFGNNFDRPAPYVLNRADVALFGVISDYWARFAAEGNPNRDDPKVVPWPAFKHAVGGGSGADPHIALDWPMREGTEWREKACDFWEGFFLGSVVGSVPAAQR